MEVILANAKHIICLTCSYLWIRDGFEISQDEVDTKPGMHDSCVIGTTLMHLLISTCIQKISMDLGMFK